MSERALVTAVVISLLGVDLFTSLRLSLEEFSDRKQMKAHPRQSHLLLVLRLH